MRPPLQTVDLDTEKRRAAEMQRRIEGDSFSLLKEGIEAYPFKEGRHVLRLLPQPAGAANAFAIKVPYLYLDPATTPGMRGYMALTAEQASILEAASTVLWRNDQYKGQMASQANTNGISLRCKWREVFIGFLRGDPQLKLYPIVLPGNGYQTRGKAKPQVATQIRGFLYERDADGAAKWGNIFDPDTGRLITIDVSGSKDRTEYVSSVDKVFPLDSSYDSLLTQIPRLEDLVDYASDVSFQMMLFRRLPRHMFEFVAQRVQLTICQDVLDLMVKAA